MRFIVHRLLDCTKPANMPPNLNRLAIKSVILALGLLSTQWLPGASPQSPAPEPACKDLNTPREFPAIATRAQWELRAQEIREQVQVSCGLWPTPERTPLKARVFGIQRREGYSVEKVYLQPTPGFYLAGNLYRPLGRGPGAFPGVLIPHGHWKEGRFVDDKDASMPALGINLARQGMVAFAYDMAGFNDTHFLNAPTNRPFYDLHRQFGAERSDQLWSISLMGFQTWNSIRALDFLASLPDVDPWRLACTGASGGGTQTFMLGALDDRLAAQAPVVMVSHTMQGGCSCENAPGLRVEYSNMELAAAAAPRPQILVGASGDWTKDTLTVEGPAIARIYQLLEAPDKLRYVRFDFRHNYNQTSREAVYAWFGHWLLNSPNSGEPKETTCQTETEAALRVFPDGKLPAGALSQEPFVAALKKSHLARWRSQLPGGKRSLERFKQQVLPAWRHTLLVPASNAKPETRTEGLNTLPGFTTAAVEFHRPGGHSAIQARYWAPPGILTEPAPRLVILCHPDDPAGTASGDSTTDTQPPAGLVCALLQRGLAVLNVNRFSTGDTPDPFANFFTTYNRTKVQERVRDLLTVCSAASSVDPRQPLAFRAVLLGTGRAGLWALLAAPGADAVVADCDQLDLSTDEALLAPDLFCPGLRNLGTFEGAPMLAAPHPLLLHNLGHQFPTETLVSVYKAARASAKLRLESKALTPEALGDWLTRVK